MKYAEDIILAPVITEASMARMSDKKYTFKVARKATKPEIATAVEKLFGVEVESVNTVSMKRKPKRYGQHWSYTSAWKKAIVTLKKDSKPIEFFEGLY